MLRLHVGQAGGQIGSQLSALTGSPSSEGHGCIFIDSEPKVIAPLISESNSSRIAWLPPSAVVYDHNGRGNNWAWGYTSVASRLGTSATSDAVANHSSAGAASTYTKSGAAGGRAKKSLLERAMDAVRLHVRYILFTCVAIVRTQIISLTPSFPHSPYILFSYFF